MADWGMGSQGTGRLTVTQTSNTSTQVTYTCTLQCIISGSAWNSSGPTWSCNFGGNTASGNWTYNGAGTYTLRNVSHTFNKDANGNGTWNFSGTINGDNSPYVTSGSTNFNMSPTRIGIAPTIASTTSSSVSIVTTTISMNTSNVGLGTSVTQRMFYKRQVDPSWTQPSPDQTGTGAKNWALTGLQPATPYHILGRAINNNSDTANLPASYPSGSYVFTTLPPPSNSSTQLSVVGVM